MLNQNLFTLFALAKMSLDGKDLEEDLRFETIHPASDNAVVLAEYYARFDGGRDENPDMKFVSMGDIVEFLKGHGYKFTEKGEILNDK